MIISSKRKIVALLVMLVSLAVVFAGGFFIGKSQPYKITAPANVDFTLFWDAYNKLHQNYIDPDTIDEQKIVYGAIAGMTQSLQDPYTSFFNPHQAKMFQQDLAGSFDGIGIEVAIRKNQLTIIAPLKGTPSDKAGLKSGDMIVKINGKSTSEMSSDDAVNLIRGKKGTQVVLTIFRDDWNNTKDFTITRDTINIPSMDWRLEDSDVAYIQVYHFDQTLSVNFKNAAFEILKSPAKKIILDLRDNPGGYLEVAQDLAGWFLPSGQIVTIEDFGKGKIQQYFKAEGNAAFANYPMVVLINEGSASASEILAGALRDNRNIQLVGEKSFGKGSVQEVVNLVDGSSFLKITIAKWLTPKGHSISEVGLTPDVKVSISDADAEAKKDSQLDKALQIVSGFPVK